MNVLRIHSLKTGLQLEFHAQCAPECESVRLNKKALFFTRIFLIANRMTQSTGSTYAI